MRKLIVWATMVGGVIIFPHIANRCIRADIPEFVDVAILICWASFWGIKFQNTSRKSGR